MIREWSRLRAITLQVSYQLGKASVCLSYLGRDHDLNKRLDAVVKELDKIVEEAHPGKET